MAQKLFGAEKSEVETKCIPLSDALTEVMS